MAEIKGILLKRRGGKFGVHMKNAWQSRHFKIQDGTILYYEEEGKKAKPRGMLTLSDCSLVKYITYEHPPPFSYSFEVIPSGKEEKWRLCAHNQLEMDLWCETLQKYVTEIVDQSSAPVSSSTPQVKEMTGFLLKRRGGAFGSHMKNAWHGRYFQIRDGVISYYEEEGDTSKPRGQMTLTAAETSMVKNTTATEQGAPSAFTFELICVAAAASGGQGNEEKWRLCASSAEEREQWCVCIQHCLAGSDSSHGQTVDAASSSVDDARRGMTNLSTGSALMSELEFADLELDEDEEGDGEEEGHAELHNSSASPQRRVCMNSSGEDITIGGDSDSVYVHAGRAPGTLDHAGHGNTPKKSLAVAKNWVSKRKSQLSHIITDINSNNVGRQGDDNFLRKSQFLDEEPLETEGTYCV